MKIYEFIEKNIGNKVIIDGTGDLAMSGELREFIFNKTPLTIVSLTKGGMAYLVDSKGKFYKVPPKNIVLLEN